MTKEPNPRVVVRMYRGAELSIVNGYLVQTPDGRYWAFPSPQEHEEKPDLASAYQLEPQHLEEQSGRDPDGRRMFLYRVTWTLPQ